MSNRAKKIEELLKHHDGNGTKFFEAKKDILKKGYSEDELVHALYSFSYDGIPDKQKDEELLLSYYKDNPDAAKEVSVYLLKQDKLNRDTETLGNLAGSSLPGSAGARHGYRFLSGMGYPYFGVLFSLVPVFILIIRFGLPRELAYVPVPLGFVWMMLRGYLSR